MAGPWEKYQSSTPQQPSGPWEAYQPKERSEQNFFERLGPKLAERSRMQEEIIGARKRGEQGYIESGFQQAGKVGAGALFDTSGEALVSLGRLGSAITPDFIEEPAKEAAKNVVDYLGNTVLGDGVRAAGNFAGSAMRAYGDFSERNPRAARNIEAATNIGLALAAAKPVKAGIDISADVGRQAGKVAKEGVDAAGNAVARAVAPTIDEGLLDVVREAQKRKIPLSLDQVAGSRALTNINKVSGELPLSGSGAFRERQMRSWNREIIKTIGQDGDKFTPKLMKKAFDDVGKEFDSLGSGKTFELRDGFSARVAQIVEDAKQTATKDSIENFNDAVGRILAETDNGVIAGEKLNLIRSNVNRLARKTNQNDTRDLLHDLELAIIDTMTDGDEAAQKAFAKTKQKYKNLLAIEPLTQQSKGGNISPAMLDNRVARIYGRQYTTGQAGDIGDLARIGNELLIDARGSDTTQKTAYLIGSAAALSNPVTATLMATGLTGNRLMQGAVLRNQGLIRAATKKTLEKQPKSVLRLDADGNLDINAIMKLPPKQAKEMLAKMKNKPK